MLGTVHFPNWRRTGSFLLYPFNASRFRCILNYEILKLQESGVIVSDWLLFNANSTTFQLYHGENKLIFNEMMMRFTLY